MFTKNHASTFTVVFIYVDDIVITGNNAAAIPELKEYLSAHFHMKDLGLLSYFLGLEMLHTTEGLFLCQKKYTKDLLAETKMAHCKPLRAPLTPNLKSMLIHDNLLKILISLEGLLAS